MSNWDRSDVIALSSLIAAIVAIIVTVAHPEVRCLVGLHSESCPSSQTNQTSPGEPIQNDEPAKSSPPISTIEPSAKSSPREPIQNDEPAKSSPPRTTLISKVRRWWIWLRQELGKWSIISKVRRWWIWLRQELGKWSMWLAGVVVLIFVALRFKGNIGLHSSAQRFAPRKVDYRRLLESIVSLVERNWKRAYAVISGNGIKIEMIAIPGGTFIMGTEKDETKRLCKKYNTDCFKSERPQHKVIVKPFFMGKFQVSQAEWRVIASLPRVNRNLELDPSMFKGDRRPVESISWDDAVEFCQRLSKQTGKKYRLPTESEWEYACRAGTNTAYHFGDTITDRLANHNRNLKKTTSVGQYPPNPFGLHDMHGNVWEWCIDDWHDNYQNAPIDNRAWFSGNSRTKVVRGGSWDCDPPYCRSAIRINSTYNGCNSDVGFRVVCVAPRTT